MIRPSPTSVGPLVRTGAVLVLMACSSEPPHRAEPSPDAAADAPAGPVELPLPDIECEPTFESIRTHIFVPTCGLPICHVGTDSALGLELVYESSQNVLVGVPAYCGNWIRVVPGDPERSFLWHKVSSEDPECGDRMPWGYERLPDNALACIREWIEGL